MRGCSLSICVGASLLAIGCGPPSRNPNGGGPPPDASNFGPDGNNGCAEGAESVYTIDQLFNHLYRFDPPSKMFTDLGGLSCPTMFGATPFSMGVDRNAVAWVLYNSGELFQVQINNHLMCTKTTWASPLGLHVFGMGFSTDTAGGSTDSLFVGGGASQSMSSYELAKVDPTTMAATMIGTEVQLPEMTGNANAELWGFMPDATTPHVVQFDKTNGSFAKDFPEPMLAGTMTGYAFAHWGGDYWVFLIKNSEPSTTVYQIDGMTGAVKSSIPNTGRTIVGAGVSTCAPTVIL
jgi:hypothetical protein